MNSWDHKVLAGFLAIAATLALSGTGEPAAAQTASLVPPPRTIADITAILDQEKPDVGKLAKLAAEADETLPKSTARAAEFLYSRAQARAALGRTREATADTEAAIKAAQGGDYVDELSRYENYLIRLLRTAGEQRRAIELLNGQIRNFESKNRGRLFNLNLMMTLSYLNLGDVPRAESYV
ncbi:MAG: hypothetical protein WAL15_24435 [Xanthobacteraceae bacterium]